MVLGKFCSMRSSCLEQIEEHVILRTATVLLYINTHAVLNIIHEHHEGLVAVSRSITSIALSVLGRARRLFNTHMVRPQNESIPSGQTTYQATEDVNWSGLRKGRSALSTQRLVRHQYLLIALITASNTRTQSPIHENVCTSMIICNNNNYVLLQFNLDNATSPMRCSVSRIPINTSPLVLTTPSELPPYAKHRTDVPITDTPLRNGLRPVPATWL